MNNINEINNMAFSNHPGYQRMFKADSLTVGVFLPLRFYRNDIRVLTGQSVLIQEIDKHNFAAIWVRDIPLFTADFGDAGQLFDPFTYLAFIAAQTKNIALATGSAIFTLRHPIDLAKMAVTIDQLSGGRLVLGVASGDRYIEFPAYGLQHNQRAERFAESIQLFRQLMQHGELTVNSSLGQFTGVELLPKPSTGEIPLIVTGNSGQSLQWIADHSDGWLTYPGSISDKQGPIRLAEKIRTWRNLIPDNHFRPHITNEWIDLVDDPNYPRTALNGGYVLRTGRHGLIELLEQWQSAGVNHAALGIQFSQRPAKDVIEEIALDILPLFSTHQTVATRPMDW
ncbi:LLM class oxidoreductase [Providencia stuartii]|uniref:LLM class oxidoreductase n=1 Tax=Providencia stuartii TaxID=588 RepID=UPI001FF5FDC7|nr:LLM class oxidoreductase [Providencia stuartii]MCK1141993.1 LLM class oxidoreductase [Providencia stuartii]